MKILQINKFFHIHGGASRYFFNLTDLLKLHGHKTAFFSMEDKKNLSSKWSEYFVSNISFERVELKDSIRKFVRMLYSFEARKKISLLLDDFKPDIAHLHSIYHQISPSIILELKKRKIPIVQTVHDYHLIAPSHTLFHDGKICEITKKMKFWKAVFHQCVKHSYLASFAEVTEKYFHYFLGWERKLIDVFIAPSNFLKNKFIEYGIDEKKIIHLPYFIDRQEFILRTYLKNVIPSDRKRVEESSNLRNVEDPSTSPIKSGSVGMTSVRVSKQALSYQDANYILYFGRLSEEKGLEFLIEVIRKLPEIKLKIVGRGSLEEILNKKIRDMKIKNIEMLGFKEEEALKSLIAGSRFTVLPSLWYENFPNSVLESFASGKAVIGSNIGGIPEQIADGHNGFLFESGNIEDCVEKITKLWRSSLLCRKLGENARKFVEQNFWPEDHYEKLMEIYKKAVS